MKKIVVTSFASGFLGAVTAAAGFGWFKEGKFNPPGAFINILGVLAIVALCTWIEDLIKKDKA